MASTRDRFKSNLKGGIDERRRQRQDAQDDIRRKKREEYIQRKRVSEETKSTNLSKQESNAALVTLINMIKQGNREMKVLVALRQLMSASDGTIPCELAISMGLAPCLVTILQGTLTDDHAIEALWICINLCYGTHESTDAAVKTPGFVNTVGKYVAHANPKVADQAIWCLANIAGDDKDYAEAIVATGIVPMLLQRLQKEPLLLTNVTCMIANMARFKKLTSEMGLAAIGVVIQMIPQVEDESSAYSAVVMIKCILETTKDATKHMAALIPHMPALLHRWDQDLNLTGVPLIIGQIASNTDDSLVDGLLRHPVLPMMLKALTTANVKKDAVKNTAWALSNITAGTSKQIQEVFNANLMPVIVHRLKNSVYEIRKELLWVAANAIDGANKEQIKFMVTQGIIPGLCQALEDYDSRMLLNTLRAIKKILQKGEPNYPDLIEQAQGLDKIEGLQEHASNLVYEAAHDIVATFYTPVEEDEFDVDSDEFHFAPPTVVADQKYEF